MSDTKRIALITGAGSGIGRAVAQALHGAGYHVVLAGRRAAELATTAEAAKPGGGTFLAIATDVADPQAVEKLFAETEKSFGRLDVLFNNAGAAAPPATIDEMSVEAWKAVVDVNLTGAFLCAREAFRIMRHQSPRGGRIINNGSISAQVPRPLAAPYTATKHALTGLTRQICLDGRAFDITASQIDIGNAATPLTERMAAGIVQADGSVKAEPRIDVAHVAAAVLMIANLPLEANVPAMTLMATKMPLLGRG